MTNIKKSSKVNYLNMQLHPKNPQAETILNLKKKNKVGASIQNEFNIRWLYSIFEPTNSKRNLVILLLFYCSLNHLDPIKIYIIIIIIIFEEKTFVCSDQVLDPCIQFNWRQLQNRNTILKALARNSWVMLTTHKAIG